MEKLAKEQAKKQESKQAIDFMQEAKDFQSVILDLKKVLDTSQTPVTQMQSMHSEFKERGSSSHR